MSTPSPPSAFTRLHVGGAEILRVRRALASYWRALLGMALVFLFWRAQRDLFASLEAMFGFDDRAAFMGLVLAWLPFVGYIAYDRLIHVFDLKNSRLLRARAGFIAHKTDEFVLSERLQISVDQTMLGRLLGFGTVAFWTGEVAGRLEWTNVPSPEAIRRYVSAVREQNGIASTPASPSMSSATAPAAANARTRTDAAQAATHGPWAPGEVPTGTRFGGRVAVIPGLSYAFSHSGSLGKSSAAKPYTWIERGTHIANYFIQTPRVDVPILGALIAPNVRHVTICSPVSGLILHSDYSYCGDVRDFIGPIDANWHPPAGTFAMLLAHDEPAPDSGAQMFGDTCQLASQYAQLFHQDSRQWSKAGIPPQEFADILRRQETANCRLVDATRYYADYLEEAARKLPALAPLLAHLQRAPATGSTSV